MYLAHYGSGRETLVSAAIGLPRFVEGTSDLLQSWWSVYLEAVHRVLDCRDVDFGFRLESSGDSLGRLLLLSGPEATRGAILEVCRRFEPLNALAEGSIIFAHDRAAHDAIAQRFPRLRGVVRRTPFQFSKCAIACDFRASEALWPLLSAAEPHRGGLFYQANYCRHPIDPEDLRQIRKNLVRLAAEPLIPAALLAHQRALVARVPDAPWLVDEFVGVEDPALWSPLRGVLEAHFARASGRLGFARLPLAGDDAGQLDDLIATGLHSHRAADLDGFGKLGAAVSRDEVLRVLALRLARPKSVLRVFISYRREDSEYITPRIYERLVRHFHPAKVFLDHKNIPLGVDFRTVLEAEGSGADVLLAVIGRHWATNAAGVRRLDQADDYVRKEIEVALRRKIPIVPLLVAGAAMPRPDDLPESLRELPFRNGMPVRPDPDFDGDIDRLIRQLDPAQAARPASS